ncbi:hypothetical protein J437_LFUL017195 [Ladona fulva]|uniref:Integrase catalytic domain-containing protein n=1 Tax=Ladona fulva TaxID=123851 RepID=A0A8K0KL66_LADFU|nr:hypothetical protein J437_LFUL017195 [Ladona fulva]
MDVVGPLPATYNGNKYILTFQDAFTKYPEAIALRDQKTETIARAFVEKIVLRHGAPHQLLTDRGENFTSTLMREVCKLLGVKKLQTTAYHPAGNGLVERSHRTLMDVLSHFVDTKQRDWDDWLPFAMSAYRSTPHTATQESPHFLMHGRDIELPFDDIVEPLKINYSTDSNYAAELRARLNIAFREVRERLRESQHQQKRGYNKKARAVNFREGDRVFLHHPFVGVGKKRKLSRQWQGPYRILEQTSPVNFRVQHIFRPRNCQLVHAN